MKNFYIIKRYKQDEYAFVKDFCMIGSYFVLTLIYNHIEDETRIYATSYIDYYYTITDIFIEISPPALDGGE